MKMKRALSLLMLSLPGLLIALIFAPLVGVRKDFYNEIWGPVFLLLHGQNPYDTSPLKADLAPLWLPMAKGLFFPFGWLQPDTAASIWFFLNIIALLLVTWLALKDETSPWLSGLAGLFVYFFPPVIHHFVLGQFSIFAMLSLLLAVRLAQAKQDWPAAFGLALALTKPQLALFAAIGLGAFYFRQNRWRGLLLFYSKTLFVAFLLSLPLFLAFPAWPFTWLANLRANPSTWAQPSIFLIASGAWKTWAILFALSLGLLLCVRIWRKQAPAAAMEWTLAITTLFAPYIWSWDFVLLLPLWLSTFARSGTRNKIMLFIVYLLAWGGMFSAQRYGDGNNQFFWWVPLWFVGWLAFLSPWAQLSQTGDAS